MFYEFVFKHFSHWLCSQLISSKKILAKGTCFMNFGIDTLSLAKYSIKYF